MNLVTIDSIYVNEEHKMLLNRLSQAAKDVVENILYENKEVRADVLEKIAALEVGDYAVYYSDFLSNTKLNPEWYPLIDRIYKEHKDTDYSEYLAALSDAFDEWLLDTNILVEQVSYLYDTSENCFKFRKGLDSLKNKGEIQNELRKNVQEDIGDEKNNPDKNLEEVSEKFSYTQEKEENDFYIVDKELKDNIAAENTIQETSWEEKEKNIFELLCKGTMMVESEGGTNAHKNLLDSVMRANDEYNKMQNQIVDMQRVIAMQKLMKDKYQEELRIKQDAMEQMQNEKSALEKKYLETKRKLDSLHSMIENTINRHSESE